MTERLSNRHSAGRAFEQLVRVIGLHRHPQVLELGQVFLDRIIEAEFSSSTSTITAAAVMALVIEAIQTI